MNSDGNSDGMRLLVNCLWAVLVGLAVATLLHYLSDTSEEKATKPRNYSITYFTTEHGLECIEYAKDSGKGVSCNWEKFNKTSGRLMRIADQQPTANKNWPKKNNCTNCAHRTPMQSGWCKMIRDKPRAKCPLFEGK